MTASPARSPAYAWTVVLLLFPVALLNYLDRQMLATMKSSIVGDIPTIANKAEFVDAMKPVYDKFAGDEKLKGLVKRIQDTK